jgi:DNA-binding transcriptional MocR family regulator
LIRDIDLIAIQDAEYEDMVIEARRIRNAEEAARRLEEERAESARRARERILARVGQLGPEPADGVAIDVRLPDGIRVRRLFAAEANGEDVYIWVAARMVDNPIDFALTCGLSELRETETLLEQGFVRPSMFVVTERD